MNSRTDSEYRLRLASEALDAAQGAFDRGDWPVCVQQAQLTVENAAKAVLATQGPVPQTHEPADELRDVVASLPNLPGAVSEAVESLIAACYALGSREHILASYGDESARLTPKDLFAESSARSALDRASSALAEARLCCCSLTSFGESDEYCADGRI